MAQLTVRRGAVAPWQVLLGGIDRLVVLTTIGVLAGLLLGAALAWAVGSRLEELDAEEVMARADDTVVLGIASNVTTVDFAAPYSADKLADLRLRLASVTQQVQDDDSGLLGGELVAGDGTRVYADTATTVGEALPTTERALLASALDGQRGWLTRLPAAGVWQGASSGHVLTVAVPVEHDGRIVGAYIVQKDLAALDAVRLLIWLAVAAGFGLTFHAVVYATMPARQQPLACSDSRAIAAPEVVCGAVAQQRLTPREREVLCLLATTLTYHEIAGQLSVSEETVRTHVKGVLNKLAQPNRTQAVLVALKSGLLEMR